MPRDLAGLVRFGSWFVLLAVLAVALFWLPRVDVLEHAVVVRNPLSTWVVPWQAIQIVDTKYALTLTTPAGRIEAWAAPASGRFTVFTLNRTWHPTTIAVMSALGALGILGLAV